MVAGQSKLDFWLWPLHDLWLHKIGNILSMNSDLPGVTRKFAAYQTWLKRLGETCFSLSLDGFACRLNSALLSLSPFFCISRPSIFSTNQSTVGGASSPARTELFEKKELLSRSRSCSCALVELQRGWTTGCMRFLYSLQDREPLPLSDVGLDWGMRRSRLFLSSLKGG